MADNVTLTTMCVVWDKEKDRVLMINRQKGDWQGYAPPGGHVDFPESLADCAIREVKEETGLMVRDLSFKGLVHFVDAKTKDRYMVFNYTTENFSGELSAGTHEGKPEWISLEDLDNITLASGVKERLELFFREGASEMHVIWDDEGRSEKKKIYL